MRAYYDKKNNLIILSDSDNYMINRRNNWVLTNEKAITLVKELKEALHQKHIAKLETKETVTKEEKIPLPDEVGKNNIVRTFEKCLEDLLK